MEWINDNTSYKFNNSDEYERLIHDEHNCNKINIRLCEEDYMEYINLYYGGVLFLELKDYLRLSFLIIIFRFTIIFFFIF